MKTTLRVRPFSLFAYLLLAATLSSALSAQSTTGTQHLDFAGLRSVSHQGRFNAITTDASGNIILLLDQKDGVRLLKTNATGTSILAQAYLGSAGDVGLAMALDPSGNIYVTGTSLAGSLTATTGAAFPAPVDSTVNSFVARFDPGLNLKFLTFCGSGKSIASSIAATADAVFITGILYGSGLPVTPSAIIQAPANGSSQNGFVQKFSATGNTLLYATYLSGQNGDTTPAAIVADAGDNAYIGGFTTATGFPTIAALIPRNSAPISGFLTKLSPAGDGITFSTFLPGSGITSMAIDPAANNLLLSGTIALGQFPVASVSAPLVNTPYQVLLRMPLDGSAAISSTLLAPGTTSSLTPGPNGTVWVDGTLSVPILPLTPLSNVGSSFAIRVSPTGSNGQTIVDQTARFGGLPATNPGFASLPLTLTSLAVDTSGSALLAGAVEPTASASLLATQTFDLPLFNQPSTALPSSVHDAVLAAGTCSGSLCAGSGAYLARLTPTASPSLALSTDASPNLVLRNLGSVAATSLTLVSTGFNLSTSCGATLSAGDECTIALGSGGPGTLAIRAGNAATQTITFSAVPPSSGSNPLAFSPREIDFGVQTSASSPLTRIITVTNLTAQPQTFTSIRAGGIGAPGSTTSAFTESASDCPLAGLNTSKLLAPNATCHITLALTASSDATKDGPLQANWTIGAGSVLLTGFQQAASLSLSSSVIDFGTQFYGGLRSSRYLYLSNNSSTALTHSAILLPANSPFTLTDACPSQLQPHTVCQMKVNYQSAVTTSSDSTTISLDQGLSVLLTGTTLPPPGTTGTGSTPTLSVSPSAITFTNAVPVTGISGTTQTVTIQNTGTSAFNLALALTGDFTDQTNCATSLPGGASCTAVLTFAPGQPGARSGLLTVTAGTTAPVLVTLSGTATPIFPANSGVLDFGNVPVGQPSVQWYKISQPFSTLTASTPSPAFKVLFVEDIGYGHGSPASTAYLQATSGSCLNCWLGIQFNPSVAGSNATTLSLSSAPAGNPYTLSLTGNGLSSASLVLSPATQDFGSVAINSSSASIAFVLTNLSSGSTPITLNAPLLAGDFSLDTTSAGTTCGTTLNPNASCLLSVLFAPTAAGQRTGMLNITTSAGAATSALTGFGAPNQDLALNPNALIFSNVASTTSTVQTITVSNTSQGTATFGAPTHTNAAFTIASTCTTLTAGSTCTLTVSFAATNALVSDMLQLPVTTTIGGAPTLTTYTVPLSATYTTSSFGLQIIPGTIDFGPASANAIAASRDFTLNNLTAKALVLTVTLPRQYVATGSPCTTLAANASCTLSVSFLPLTNGDIPGTLSVIGAPADGTPNVTGVAYLKGYGNGVNALTVSGTISPGRVVDFGQVPSGQSARQVLTLTNTSTPAASITATTVNIRRITSQWPFLSTTTCGGTLSIGQSCTVTLTYSPLNQVANGSTAAAPIADNGTLTIESDATSGPDLLSLTGMSTAAAVTAPSNIVPLIGFTASQNSLTYALTAIGSTSAPQTVSLTNIGSTTLHIASLAASSDFTLSGTCPVLVPGASCPLTIAFAPQISALNTGPRIGTIEISSDASTSLEFLTLLGNAGTSPLLFAPASLNFGAQLVGTTAALPITITNTTGTPATFNGITPTGDFSAAGTCPTPGGLLPASASCTVQVSFAPTATGVRTGTLGIASTASPSPLVAMLTGVGVQSHLSISPSSLTFGNVTVGATSSLSLTLANTGSAPITGIAFHATGDFAVASPCAFTTLSAGVSCSVTIAFTPTTSGTRTGALTITTSDPSSPNTVPLAGTGVALPSSGSFTLTVDGSTSSSQTVRQTLPASYTLTLTPVGGFTGPVVLSCSAVTSGSFAACSIANPTLTLSSTSQTSTVTITTLSSSASIRPNAHLHLRLRGLSPTTFCILLPAILFFWRFRRTLASRPTSLLLALLSTTLILLTTGCGTGNVSLKYTTPGSYQYTVTASSTSGTVVAQTVTLNLVITQ